jgi:hypothetical protein
MTLRVALRTNWFRSRRRWRADSSSQKARIRHAPRQITRRTKQSACVTSVIGFEPFLKFSNLKNAIVELSGFNSRVRWQTVWLASHLFAKLGRQIAAHSFELCWPIMPSNAGTAAASAPSQLRRFDRALITSGLRPIPDKRIGTSQDVAMAQA